MSQWIDLYTQKCQGIQKFAEITNVDINAVLEKYATATFNKTTINKRDAFKGALNRKVTAEEVQYFKTVCELPNKDARKPSQYAIDIILGWITEDITIIYLSNSGISCVMAGTDKKREFLNPSQIGSNPDLFIFYRDSQPAPLELIYDYTGYWEKANKLDLRLNKYENLKKRNALILGIAPEKSRALLLDTRKEHPDITKGKIVGYGGKEGYTLHNINQHLQPMHGIIETLKEILKK
jgi:hypothetical protein